MNLIDTPESLAPVDYYQVHGKSGRPLCVVQARDKDHALEIVRDTGLSPTTAYRIGSHGYLAGLKAAGFAVSQLFPL